MAIYVNQFQKGLATIGLPVAKFQKRLSHLLYNTIPKWVKQPKMNSYPPLSYDTPQLQRPELPHFWPQVSHYPLVILKSEQFSPIDLGQIYPKMHKTLQNTSLWSSFKIFSLSINGGSLQDT